MNEEINKPGGGKSFIQWWANPKNRQKVYDSDKADAEELRKLNEQKINNPGESFGPPL